VAFRDDFGDPVAANRFAQHVGIAEDLLEQIERIPRAIEALPRGDGLTQETMDTFAQRWAKGWQDVWDQLHEARGVVAQRGRDTAGYDAAREAAGDIYVDVASGKVTRIGNEVHFSWKAASTQSARHAIAALRTAMPEVVVTKQAPVDVDLEPTSNKLFVIAGALGVLGVFAYLVYRVIS
jgi:hypothetical protein